MPSPVYIVLAVVGTVAAGYAFKEFVYEPHIAPKIERWTDEFVARRQLRRRRRAGPMAVPVHLPHDSDNTSDSGDEYRSPPKREFEMEKMPVSRWREGVRDSEMAGTGLRHRKRLSNNSRQGKSSHPEMQQTQVLFDSHIADDDTTPLLLLGRTSTSTLRSPPPPPPPPRPVVPTGLQTPISSPPLSPSHPLDSLHSSPALIPRSSTQTLRSPQMSQSPTSPGPGPQNSLQSPTQIPSLSLSHPIDLTDAEQDVELLSAPSSRSDSPFSAFSHGDVSSRGAASPFAYPSPHHLGMPMSPESSALLDSSTTYHSFTASPARGLSAPHVRSARSSTSELDFLSDLSSLHGAQTPISEFSSVAGGSKSQTPAMSDVDVVSAHEDDDVRSVSESEMSWASVSSVSHDARL